MENPLSELYSKVLSSAPPTIYYIPNFITEDEEKYLVRQVYAAPKPKWTQLSNRRLQNWGGLPHEKGMVPEKLPNWLQVYCNKIGELGAFDGKIPNHVLVNEYLPGQGIMPHTDGPLYFPTVSTITLGSHTLLDFYSPLQTGESSAEAQCRDTSFESRHKCTILLERRSLILVRDDMYKHFIHGIKETKTDILTDQVINLEQTPQRNVADALDRETRISLTIRVVPKVLKAKLFFNK